MSHQRFPIGRIVLFSLALFILPSGAASNPSISAAGDRSPSFSRALPAPGACDPSDSSFNDRIDSSFIGRIDLSARGRSDELISLYYRMKHHAAEKVLETLEETGYDTKRHPMQTDPKTGYWETSTSREWTSGFFAGILWMLYEWTGDESWKRHAEGYTLDLEKEKNYAGDHDMGFRIFNSFGHGWRLTGNREYRQVILQGAVTLAGRYDPGRKAIRSWDWMGNFPVIIDNMMNLELLFRAAEESGNSHFRRIALEHAATTMKHHLREDGSHYHIVDFDNRGEPVWKGTIQGYGPESAWSRGQAWGIYGFTVTYRYSGDPDHLTAARKMADYFLDHLPADVIPYYDFLEPAIPNATRDVSAAAIAASALTELWSMTGEPRYLVGAERLLLSLGSPPYLQPTREESQAENGPVASSILDKGTRWRGDPERGLIYADYYFLEALGRYAALKGVEFPPIRHDYSFTLEQNFPNPFHDSTTIFYSLTRDSRVRLRLFDAAGRQVRVVLEADRPVGSHRLEFDATGLASGLYYLRLETEEGTLFRPMIRVR